MMAERNVVKPYVPPDFDITKLPSFKKRDGGKSASYITLPIGLQCCVCSNVMYKDQRVHIQKQVCPEVEDYEGKRRWFLYIPCSACSAEMVIKTNPEHSDYDCITGATRFDIATNTPDANATAVSETTSS